MFVVADDFNYPLQQAAPNVGSHDSRFCKALQIDKMIFQQLIVDLALVAPPKIYPHFRLWVS